MDIKELYFTGVTFDEFISVDNGSYREKALDIYNSITIDNQLLDNIKSIDKKIYVMVFAEIWCPDCIINLPALKKISDINQNIQFRILPREGYEDYMEDFKINGKAKIPTFIFMDQDFNILGSFIEIPDIIKEILSKGSQVDIMVAKRKYKKGEFCIETIQDIIKKIS